MANEEEQPKKSTSQVEPRVPGWIEWTRSIGIAIILAMLIRWPVAEPYKIPTGSMEPTFMPGDRIFVAEIKKNWAGRGMGEGFPEWMQRRKFPEG